MSLRTDDLDKIAEDIFKDRIILQSTFCGNCGYNLKQLPFAGVCPECGGTYNARPLKMEGIFLPQFTELPLWDLSLFVIFLLIALGAFATGFSPTSWFRLTAAAVLALLSLAHGISADTKLREFLKARRVYKRIDEEEDW